MRYFIDISYDGSSFSGWQIQHNSNSVQATLEDALKTILQRKIKVVGSGRTDAGVHATQQIAHFDYELLLPSTFLYNLNNVLLKAISVNAVFECKNILHARFDAMSRIYHYHIHRLKNPFKKNYSYYFTQSLDVASISQACKIIAQHQDFQCFSKVRTEVKNFNCQIHHIAWNETATGYFFEVSANRFLRGMVRAMVGTLIGIGEGRISLVQLKKILSEKDRRLAGRSVPPEGLFLHRVEYPNNSFHQIF